jgi:molybdopterin/thiamine biosynthesis adenylyltransferase
MTSTIYIIGTGGGGSWLAPAIISLTSPKQVVLMDGDTLEHKNLDRQLFNESDVGQPKCESLARRYGCQSHHGWFAQGVFNFEEDDWLLVCVDNHAARKDALVECDRNGCQAIFAANETWSAESYLYIPKWRGTPLDPRVYYPEILTDKSGDPRAAAIGCTGDEARSETPQLVSSNMMSAALSAHLFALWRDYKGKKQSTLNNYPYRRMVTKTGEGSHCVGDLERTEHAK